MRQLEVEPAAACVERRNAASGQKPAKHDWPNLATFVHAPSPFERAYGTPEAFAALVQAEIDAGAVDPHDAHYIIMAIERWHADRVWAV
jgi:hypothetical protein